MDLLTPVEKIAHVGPVYKARLKKLGIKTVRDAIYHFPHRYEDFSNIIPINKIKDGQICTVLAKVLEIQNERSWKRRRMTKTLAIVQDKTGPLQVIWFNQPYLTKSIQPGDTLFLSGKITLRNNALFLVSPTYEKDDSSKGTTSRIVPVYPETEGLSSKWFRHIVKSLLVNLKNKIPETLPNDILKQHGFSSTEQALWQIHFPDLEKQGLRAQERFSFEELFLIHVFVLREKIKIAQEKSIPVAINIDLIKRFVDSLPFKLTDAQKKCSWQILKDLEKPYPMNRLLEGDVGSGKTVVAAIAALNITKAGYQAAFMAPTEILAKQHFQELFKLLKKFNLNIGLLTGKEDKFYSKRLKNEVVEISRQKLLSKSLGKPNPYLKNLPDTPEGRAKKTDVGIDLLIGTHALIQDKVKFGKLALVILDEQHRFGVEQRAKMCHQSSDTQTIPHLLSMTATPIPRTLALTIYGDLDLSLLDQLPKGRKKIITEIISPEKRNEVYAFIKKEAKKGRQIFIICPRIDSSETKDSLSEEKLEIKAVKEEYERLSKDIFPNLKLAMLHGKIRPKEKEQIMQKFKSGKIDVLVSTSVVEVGIDVPGATVMVIEGAERFGLAQLHQFRGRVGRSKYQSFCFLFTESKSKKTFQRLYALLNSQTSFELAEKDLEIRGPGDFFGQRQWGVPSLVMKSLQNQELVIQTKNAAKEILSKDPQLKSHPVLLKALKDFRERVHLE